jgi:hypothetical protein
LRFAIVGHVPLAVGSIVGSTPPPTLPELPLDELPLLLPVLPLEDDVEPELPPLDPDDVGEPLLDEPEPFELPPGPPEPLELLDS